MSIKHIVFDLDGTLIDSEEAVLKAWKKTYEEYGYFFSMEELALVFGITMADTIKKLNTKVDENFGEKWRKNYKIFAEEAEYFPGVEKMLAQLKKEQYHLGIVTSRCRQEYNEFFGKFNLEDTFDIIILDEDTVKHKPDAQPMEKYMEKAGCTKEECIYIGDMKTDVLCGNNAGVTSGYVTWNNTGRQCKEADVVFETTEDLIEFLNK